MAAAVVIGFGGGLRVEEVFLASLEGKLKFWEETRLMRNQSYAMVALECRFKWWMGGK